MGLFDHNKKRGNLLRCSCGGLLWDKSPQSVMQKHNGHQMRYAINGTLWEKIKLTLGWIK